MSSTTLFTHLLNLLLLTIVTFSSYLYAVEESAPLRFYSGSGSTQQQVYQARMDAAFKRVGRRAEMLTIPGQRALVISNTVGDGAIRLKNIQEMAPDNTQNLRIVPEVFETRRVRVFVQKGRELKIEDWDSLKPYRNGIRRGTKIFELKVPGADEGKREMRSDSRQLFKMLHAGRIDVVVEWEVLGQGILKDMGLEQDIVVLPTALQTLDLYLFVHKKHQDLIPNLVTALKAMKADGSYQQIKRDILQRTSK